MPRYSGIVNPKFVALTFGSCTLVFAGVWGITAPASPTIPVAAAPPAMLYADCDAVRAAGAAPLRAGQPGYRPALDANMNGVACEPVGAAADTGSIGYPAPAPNPVTPPPAPRAVDPAAPPGALPPTLEVQM